MIYPDLYFHMKEKCVPSSSHGEFVYSPISISEIENLGYNSNNVLIKSGLIEIFDEFYKSKPKIDKELITSYAIYKLLPYKIRKFFSYYLIDNHHESIPEKKVIFIDIYKEIPDMFKSIDMHSSSISLGLQSLNSNYEDKSYLIYKKISHAKNTKFINDKFFNEGYTYSNFDHQFILDPFISSFDERMLRTISLGGFLSSSKKEKSEDEIASFKISPIHSFNVYKSRNEDNNFEIKDEYFSLDFYEKYYYLKKVLYASK